MRKKLVLGAVFLLLGGAWARPSWASPEESAMADRLAAQATEFLDQLLGAGKSRVIISVQGETSEVRSETETTTPIAQKPPAPKSDAAEESSPAQMLPGYSDAME